MLVKLDDFLIVRSITGEKNGGNMVKELVYLLSSWL